MNLDASLSYPGQTILSGPAASVMGSLPYAASRGDTLVLDIGGTTTDMALLVDGAPLLAPSGIELGPFKTLIRALQSHSLALGGDSVVACEDGEVHIGPQRLGPAMAYGGPLPTPTDALLVLGKEIQGDYAAARNGIDGIAAQLGMPAEAAAQHIFDLACRNILDGARQMVLKVNSKPVYTVHELLEGYQVLPKQMLVLGGPAPHFAARLEELSDFAVQVVPDWQVANAAGAAMARTTCEVTLFADTERGIASAPEENFFKPIRSAFSRQDATELAGELLRAKAIREGADTNDLEIDTLEDVQFNMVRGFHATGRNIRVKVQIKPGLIHEYRRIGEEQ